MSRALTNQRTAQTSSVGLLASLRCAVFVLLCGSACVAQQGGVRGPQIRRVLSAQHSATVRQHHSQLVQTEKKISRIAVTAPELVNFVQYSPTEVAVIGLNVGSTDLTMWFAGESQPVIYEVTVVPGTQNPSDSRGSLQAVSEQLAAVFPRSRVRLVPVADQLVVQGQAWDTAEAGQIQRILEAQFGGQSRTVVNMMRVPGEFQVMLRVRIAELNRAGFADWACPRATCCIEVPESSAPVPAPPGSAVSSRPVMSTV